jgi:ParB family chromosome partitioning protein
MATAPASGVVDLVQPGDVITLNPAEIVLGERLRPIDQAWATAIGQSMAREGQIHAVDVRRNSEGQWELAGAGGHRVTGARLTNIPVECRVVAFGSDLIRRREAAENLFRRANDPLERAESMAELVRLHRENAGIEAADRRGKSVPKRLKEEAEETCATFAQVYGWAEEVGAELGFSKRTVQYDLLLYRSLPPSLIKQLRDAKHPILKNASQLRALAKLPTPEQGVAAARLVAGVKSIGEAIALVRRTNKPLPEDKRLSAFIGAFQRMSLAERKGALSALAPLLPKDWMETIVEAR